MVARYILIGVLVLLAVSLLGRLLSSIFMPWEPPERSLPHVFPILPATHPR
jgi:hypothetical protein